MGKDLIVNCGELGKAKNAIEAFTNFLQQEINSAVKSIKAVNGTAIKDDNITSRLTNSEEQLQQLAKNLKDVVPGLLADTSELEGKLRDNDTYVYPIEAMDGVVSILRVFL